MDTFNSYWSLWSSNSRYWGNRDPSESIHPSFKNLKRLTLNQDVPRPMRSRLSVERKPTRTLMQKQGKSQITMESNHHW